MVRPNWGKCVRWLGASVVAAVVVSTLTPVWNIAGKSLAVAPQHRPADAVVVLGAGLMPNGSLSEESLRRAFQGFILYKKGLAPRIVLSGPPLRNGLAVESEVRAKLAVEIGIPETAILQERAVNTTRDEAGRIRELFEKSGSPAILLVTESLHMRRAKLVFERAGFRVFPAPSDDYADAARSTSDRLFLMQRILREITALMYYRVAGYI
jgi:uncharacterized SAM-binding protein YcdF (DUF218 family)